jgi:hypothetical protein
MGVSSGVLAKAQGFALRAEGGWALKPDRPRAQRAERQLRTSSGPESAPAPDIRAPLGSENQIDHDDQFENRSLCGTFPAQLVIPREARDRPQLMSADNPERVRSLLKRPNSSVDKR